MKNENLEITIIDYGVGNTFSVYNAIKSLGYKKVKISNLDTEISSSDALILPGVGAFETCANNLRKSGIIDVLNECVLNSKKPIFGICVGMQLFASFSEENGIHEGLNWIPGRVIKLTPRKNCRIPHVGWNKLSDYQDSLLLKKIEGDPIVYFDHSYYFDCDSNYKTSLVDYGEKLTSSVQKDNIVGVQFHPEKSQSYGLKIFRSFLNSI